MILVNGGDSKNQIKNLNLFFNKSGFLFGLFGRRLITTNVNHAFIL